MLFPKLKRPEEKAWSIEKFGSLISGEKVPEGCFTKMENLTADAYPLMSIREKRGIYKGETPLYFNGERVTTSVNTTMGILFCTEKSLYIGGEKIEGVYLNRNVKNRKAVLFGRNVFIVPDGIYVKNTDDGIKVIHVNRGLRSGFGQAFYSTDKGEQIEADYVGELPANPSAGTTAICSTSDSMYLYQYTGDKWQELYPVYICLAMPLFPEDMTKDTSFYIESKEKLFDDGYHTVIFSDEKSLVMTGRLYSQGEISGVDITINLPVLDFAVEHNNRLWGCRYGEDANGKFVNEIYASKLGSPEEWYSFQGISTDSYAVNLGCYGEFTGAATLGNEVLFFKENFIIRVLGSTPSEFSVYTVPARGVEKGHHSSVVNLEGRLFYKATDGIAVYDGTMPEIVSEKSAFNGFSDSVACGIDGKYKIALTDTDGIRGIYVFDTRTGLWHREDDSFNTRFMFTRDSSAFFLGENENELTYTLYTDSIKKLKNENTEILLKGDTPYRVSAEDEVMWYCETGKIGDSVTSYNKRVRTVRFYIMLGEDSLVRASIKPDSRGEYEEIFCLDKKTEGICAATVPTVPCKYFSFRLSGKGEFTLHSVDIIALLQGEVKNFE